ncbi:response regulator [Paenibacillus oenotherae]|uniref:histidine kinase n=1 Tax=Paenibacillus oenotherae TaxID=1435645 RepID=A0ABS7D6S3_9BACL|nr:ATP-binding protein [Paenibacillus oenotherae]MBW7475483.1 response regulator [Paenibacillus oenotherae]
MTTKRKIFLIAGLFFLALTGLRLLWVLLPVTSDSPQAIQGKLDLRGWDFSKDRTISLNGQWEFYPHVLLNKNTDIGLSSDRDRELLEVPGSWNDVMPGKGASTFGYGSYRLRILVQPDKEQIYGIRVPVIPTSSELYVNGRLIAHAGEPESDAERYTARKIPYTASFATELSEIEIVIQVANFDDTLMGGINWPIQFGSDHAAQKAASFSNGMQLSICLILLMHAVYAGILFLMGVRQKGLLYFALLIISGIVAILIDDSSLLLIWLPISYDMTLRIYYLAYLGNAVFLLQFVKHLIPEYFAIRGLRAYIAACTVYAIAALFLPIRWLSYADLLHTLILIIPFLIVPVRAFKAAVSGNKDSIYILLGLTAITTNIVWGLIKNTGWQEMEYYPFDMLAASIAFASYWFMHYIRSSAQTAELAEQLLKEDKRKDQFLVNTSHELRNPLHGILNIAQTVISSGGKYGEDKNKENMKLLIAVGKRMSFLLNDLLDLTRLKEDRIRLRAADIRVQALASGVIDMLQFLTAGKPIRLVNRIPAEFPHVRADENRVIQILFNLLHNAVKFTNEGSITVEAHTEGDQAVIVISDTGIGMDEKTQRSIFEPYEQGGMEEAAHAGGLGLGLSICKQLVDLHGGTLAVSSIPGSGSAFTFTLPLSPATTEHHDAASPAFVPVVLDEAAAAASVASAEPETLLTPDRPQILAVDDDPINLSILEGVLSSDSCDIVTATSGQAALSLLAAREWDLVISDVMMPHMSGYQLARIIRERFSISELPILLLTARSRPEDIEAGFLAGANDYVTKPVDALELKSRVRALTASKRSFRERLRMEGALLQAQIQPHFLFNTLNSVAALSELDTTRMNELLEVFGNYLRASFNPHNLDRLVPLKHELDLVRSYLYIEKERFDDRLQIDWEVDERIQLKIPPLSIQPLVENAVRHGVLKRIQGGTVRIRISEYAEYAEVAIEDDGVGMDEPKSRQLLDSSVDTEGIGLRNTDRRLKQLYGQGLQIHSTPGKGTAITFRVQK